MIKAKLKLFLLHLLYLLIIYCGQDREELVEYRGKLGPVNVSVNKTYGHVDACVK